MMYGHWIWRFTATFLLLGTAGAKFPENRPAISATTVHDLAFSYFIGGHEESLKYVQDMKMVKIAGKDFFAITGREKLFLVEPGKLTIAADDNIPHAEVYTWHTDIEAKKLCMLKGQSEENCENYIRIVEQMDSNGDKVLVCGTNSYEPKCRYILASMSQDRLQLNDSSELFSGNDKCPFGPDKTGASIYTGNSLYTATATDFNSRSPIITRSLGEGAHLRTPKYDNKFLNDPKFVKIVDDDDRVLVFMNEQVETENGDVSMAAYVAQICKNDAGGQHILVEQWTKFVKTRLNCSRNGFYFDQLQDVSDPVPVKTSSYSDSVTETIYATFTTPENSVPGSAVCSFTLDSIHDALQGRFREERGSRSKKSNAPAGPMHPGKCPGAKYTNSELQFLKSHPLIEDQARGDLLSTYVGERWTTVSVDTTAGPHRNWTVYFVGTDRGQVVRYLSPTGDLKNAALLKRQDVYDSTRCQNSTSEDETTVNRIAVADQQLLVAFKHCVVSTPLNACAVHKCERSCVESADPYCGWNGSKCINYLEPSAKVQQHVFVEASNPSQNVDAMCPDLGFKSENEDVGTGGVAETDYSEKADGAEDVDVIKNDKRNDTVLLDNVDDTDTTSKSPIQLAGVNLQIIIVACVVAVVIGIVVGFCISKACCRNGKMSSDMEKGQESITMSKASLANNKDSLCKKIIASISPKRKRKGSMKPPSLSQSQSTLAENQGEPLVSKDHSKLDEFVHLHDNTTTDRYVNVPPHGEKRSKLRLNSSGSGSQVTMTDSVASYTSRRRGSAQPALAVPSGHRATPNLYSTAPRPRHHSGNRTSDPSEYNNQPTMRLEKTGGRSTSRHSTPVPVVGYPSTPNSLKDYSFNFHYEQVVESTENVLDDVKEVIEQQQRRSQEMETLAEEDDVRLRHMSSDSGKGSSPRNSVQTEEQDKLSSLSRNRPDNLVLGPVPGRGRKRLNSEPTSPTTSQPPLPPPSSHKPVSRSTSMRSQYAVSMPNYPQSRTRSGSFTNHHSQSGNGTPMKMHQVPQSAFMPQTQPNSYATLPINQQIVSVPTQDHFSRQMSYDTYSPMRYPAYVDHSDHPAMNMPDRFSSLPSRSQAHRSNKKAYAPQQQYPVAPQAQVQMRRSSATPRVPQYMKQMSTPAKFEQHSRPGRGKYVPPPSVPGLPSPLPEQNAV